MPIDADTPVIPSGLDAEQVHDRAAAGCINTISSRPSKSLSQILRANLLTRFNAILGALLIVVLVVILPVVGILVALFKTPSNITGGRR